VKVLLALLLHLNSPLISVVDVAYIRVRKYFRVISLSLIMFTNRMHLCKSEVYHACVHPDLAWRMGGHAPRWNGRLIRTHTNLESDSVTWKSI